MSCVLHVLGRELDVAALLARTRFVPITFWKQGEPRYRRSSHLMDSSGANFEVSAADIGDNEKQIEDAIAFLEKEEEEVRGVVSFLGVERVELDFGFELHDSIRSADTMPAKLVALAGKLGLAITLSYYPKEHGKWRYIDDV